MFASLLDRLGWTRVRPIVSENAESPLPVVSALGTSADPADSARGNGPDAAVPVTGVENLAEILAAHNLHPRFTVIEVGALPDETSPEPFHALLQSYPGSRNLAFEVDEALCERLNRSARPGMEFHASALGGAHEPRIFHGTAHPMCSSLYEPDERWADLFHRLDVMRKTYSGTLAVTTLERFTREQGIDSVDFIKLDIQGAELEFMQGAGGALDAVVCLVCEVAFVPLYGDVDSLCPTSHETV